jgi:hypothetical protein
MTGLPASGPIFPSPKTAVPLETTATRFPFAVYLYASSGVIAISRQGSATPGVVCEREVALRCAWLCQRNLNLSFASLTVIVERILLAYHGSPSEMVHSVSPWFGRRLLK